MKATFIHDGDAIDYRPAEDTDSGSVVVQNGLVGVTKRPLKAGELGSLHLVGVYELPKATGGGTGLDVGTRVYWDAGEGRVTTSASGNTLLGRVTVAAGDDDETVSVRLMPTLAS